MDKRIGNCTVLASNKCHEIFKECQKSLGVSGDATNDVFSAWNKLASDAFHRRTVAERRIQPHSTSLPPRRSNSLTGLNGKTVKVPVQLIPLERACALTSGTLLKDEPFWASIRSTGRHSIAPASNLEESLTSTITTCYSSVGVTTTRYNPDNDDGVPSTRYYPNNDDGVPSTRYYHDSDGLEEIRPEISRPINLEESTLCCSYPSGLSYRKSMNPYTPQADGNKSSGSSSSSKDEATDSPGGNRKSEIEADVGPEDVRTGIQNYIDKAFNTADHPLGTLMNRIEMVYRLSYAGVGASKFLLPHAIAETHSIIQRIHSIVRYI